MEIRVLIKHSGKVEDWEYGYRMTYKAVPGGYETMSHAVPENTLWCRKYGDFRECDVCEEESCYSIAPQKLIEIMRDSWIRDGYPFVREGEVLSVDITGHDPVFCDEHVESGCVVCWGCKENHNEE